MWMIFRGREERCMCCDDIDRVCVGGECVCV